MKPIGVSALTICGLAELPEHGPRLVTHVLSLLDPQWPADSAFDVYGPHQRTALYFHDIIDPAPGLTVPTRGHVEQILEFGGALARELDAPAQRHLLVHCHMGISRSTAAMLTLLAQVYPAEPEDHLFERLRLIRPQAWPNSLMLTYADEMLGRQGRLINALRRHYGLQRRAQPQFDVWMRQLGRERELDMAA